MPTGQELIVSGIHWGCGFIGKPFHGPWNDTTCAKLMRWLTRSLMRMQVTHRLEELEHADSASYIADGRVQVRRFMLGHHHVRDPECFLVGLHDRHCSSRGPLTRSQPN